MPDPSADRNVGGDPPTSDPDATSENAGEHTSRNPGTPRGRASARPTTDAGDGEIDKAQEESEQGAQDHSLFLQRHSATLGRPMSDIERERILTLGPAAVGHGEREQDKSTPVTVNGPLDHADEGMADRDLWKRQEKAHIERNRSEVDRATKASKQAGHGELIAVRTGMTGEHANRVAFTEINPIHPHGYAYVAGIDSAPVLIAPTPAAQEALLFHRIVKVAGEMPPQLREHFEEQAESNQRRARA